MMKVTNASFHVFLTKTCPTRILKTPPMYLACCAAKILLWTVPPIPAPDNIRATPSMPTRLFVSYLRLHRKRQITTLVVDDVSVHAILEGATSVSKHESNHDGNEEYDRCDGTAELGSRCS